MATKVYLAEPGDPTLDLRRQNALTVDLSAVPADVAYPFGKRSLAGMVTPYGLGGLENTMRYLGVEVDDALALSEQIEL
jgi:hypothetical protein